MNNLWVHQFNKIYIFCPTYKVDKTWSPIDQHILSKKVKVFKNIDPRILQSIWNRSSTIKAHGNDNFHVLLYFDDCADDENFKSNYASGLLNRVAFKANHSNISSIFVVQYYVMCAPIIRNNVEFFISFYVQAETELKKIWNELGIGKFCDFKEVFRKYTKEKYSFFLMNRQTAGEPRYYHNLYLINNKEFFPKAK